MKNNTYLLVALGYLLAISNLYGMGQQVNDLIQALNTGDIDLAKQIVLEDKAVLQDEEVAEEVWEIPDPTKNQVEIVNFFLDQGLSPNQLISADIDPITQQLIQKYPLQIVLEKSVQYVSPLLKLLIRKGINVNQPFPSGYLPINFVQNLEVLQFLIDKGGANVNMANNFGLTPFQVFAYQYTYYRGNEVNIYFSLIYVDLILFLVKSNPLFSDQIRNIAAEALGDLPFIKSKNYPFGDADSFKDFIVERLLKNDYVTFADDLFKQLLLLPPDEKWLKWFSFFVKAGIDPAKYFEDIFSLNDYVIFRCFQILIKKGFDLAQINENQKQLLVQKNKWLTIRLLKKHNVKFSIEVESIVDSPMLRHAQVQVELKERFEKKKILKDEQEQTTVKQVTEASLKARLTQLESYLGFIYNEVDPISHFTLLLERILQERFNLSGKSAAPYIAFFTNENDRDRKYQEEYYNVVHSHNASPALVNLLQTIITDKLKILTGKNIRLRMGSPVKQHNLDAFLDYGYQKFPGSEKYEEDGYQNAVWLASSGEFAASILSVNFCVFGGQRDMRENTAEYFFEKDNISDPMDLMWTAIFKPLHFDFQFIELIKNVFSFYKNKGLDQNIIQIFLLKKPTSEKKGINDFVYISEAYGTPHRSPIDGKIYARDAADYLEKYITDPKSLGMFPKNLAENEIVSNVEALQGRVVLFSDLYKDALIFSDNMMNDQDKASFKKDIEEVVDAAIAAWITTGAYKQLIGDPNYGRLARLVDLYTQGELYKRLIRLTQTETVDEILKAKQENLLFLQQLKISDPDKAQQFEEGLNREFKRGARLLLKNIYVPKIKKIMSEIENLSADVLNTIEGKKLLEQAVEVIIQMKRLSSKTAATYEQALQNKVKGAGQ